MTDTKFVNSTRRVEDGSGLNITRSRRSKSSRSGNKTPTLRNPLVDHTIDDDLKYIREYASKYTELDDNVRERLDQYVFDGKDLQYYYGAYVATYQLFVMGFMSNNDMTSVMTSMIYVLSHRIVNLLDSMKNDVITKDATDKK